MIQFIVAVFVMLAAAFWVLSGGSDFVPETRPEPSIAAAEAEAPAIAAPVAAPEPEPEPEPEMEPEPEADPLPEAAPEPQAAPQPAATAQPAFTAPVIIEAPAQEPEAAPEPEPIPAPNADLRRVDADRVNLRSGPSTDYRVLDTLTRDTQVEVLSIDTLGSEPWAQLLVVETGLEGFMATRFLTAQ